MTTSPCSVNLTPLLTRFWSTCRSRAGSPASRCGTSRRMMAARAILFPGSRAPAFSRTASTTARREKFSWAKLIRPASILEKSSTSLMTWRRALALSVADSANSRWRGSSRVCVSSSTMPRMPPSGVRSSWLMFARNSLLAVFARLACSAMARDSAAAT